MVVPGFDDVTTKRRGLGMKLYSSATWVLIVLFGLLAVIHVVLTVLFYLGIWIRASDTSSLSNGPPG